MPKPPRAGIFGPIFVGSTPISQLIDLDGAITQVTASGAAKQLQTVP